MLAVKNGYFDGFCFFVNKDTQSNTTTNLQYLIITNGNIFQIGLKPCSFISSAIQKRVANLYRNKGGLFCVRSPKIVYKVFKRNGSCKQDIICKIKLDYEVELEDSDDFLDYFYLDEDVTD